jgi:hypothetical protein
VTERLKELAWKASEGQKPSGGSNPPLSAIFTRLVKVGPVGSRARERREPGQVRKEAAISVRLLVPGVPDGFHLRGPCDPFPSPVSSTGADGIGPPSNGCAADRLCCGSNVPQIPVPRIPVPQVPVLQIGPWQNGPFRIWPLETWPFGD